jgi:methylglyoxal synthase
VIALIAHDKKKLDLAMFVRQHRDFFMNTPTVATQSTGQTLRD